MVGVFDGASRALAATEEFWTPPAVDGALLALVAAERCRFLSSLSNSREKFADAFAAGWDEAIDGAGFPVLLTTEPERLASSFRSV